MQSAIHELTQRLVATLHSYKSGVVAFSGGVDSAVVAKAAQVALGKQAIAVTAVGPAVATEELETARQTAKAIGIRHVELCSREIERPAYRANAPDRCYHCKSELYRLLREFADQEQLQTVCNGTQLDDLRDYRPGLQAAEQYQVHSPLVECRLDKEATRAVARYWGLEVWSKPAAPCLASRLAYGQEVTPERLQRIDLAEQFLQEHGLMEVRVRHHAGNLARIEVPLSQLATLAEPALRASIVEQLGKLGFRYITLDLAGFRSGSFNLDLPRELVTLAPPAGDPP